MARAKNRSPAVVTAAVSVMVFLSWQGWVAGRNGLSDVYARPAISYLEDKSAADLPISEAEWQAVHDSISRADELMPGNPRYLDSLGWLEQVKLSLLADTLDIDQVDAHARAAKGYYGGAVAARPTWTYYWGNLAMEMYRRGNYDTDEYSAALANAARFGPWKSDTQRLVAELGRDTLGYLSSNAKQELFLILERGLTRQPDEIFKIIGDWQELCTEVAPIASTLPLLSSHCERHIG